MTPRERLAVLNALTSQEDVQRHLFAKKVWGARMASCSCPVARYIGGRASVQSAVCAVVFFEKQGTLEVEVHEKLNWAVLRFIDAFDRGRYPELEFPRKYG